MKYYIFRIDRNDFVLEELKEGRLRQGWGVSNMSLLDSQGRDLSQDEWIENYHWKDESKERKISKYNNLKNMLNMEAGDLIVIPRAPEWDSFTIGRVKEKYRFSLGERDEDFGHLIELCSDSIKSYKYGSNDVVREITSKFRSYQSPVNNVYNGGLIESLEKLLEESFKEEEKADDYEDDAEAFTIASYCLNLKELEEKKIRLTVPIYQRPYSWGEIQIKRFLSGIMESFGELERGKKRKNMFIGTIQLGSNDEGGFDIIDGQQRLTTLNLLMLYLQDNEGSPVQYFKTDVGGQQEYLARVFSQYRKRDFLAEDISLRNIYESNLKTIAEFIEGNEALESLQQEFIRHIKNNLKFVVVETRATLTETLNIFDTINTSGMDLNGADVFKIKIYEYMKKSKQAGKEVFNEIDGLYKKVIEENKKYSTSVTMGQILELYKDYLISVNNLPISVMKMGTDSFFEKLFDGLIRKRFDSKLLTEENIKNIKLCLSDVAGLIEARFLWEEMRKSISIEARFEEQLIYWSRYGRYFKAVYYTLFKEKNQDPAAVSILIKKLCKLFTVYSVVYDKQVNDMMKFMKDIYADILKGEPLEKIFSEIEKTTEIHPQGGSIYHWFNSRINEPLAAKTTAKNLLCRIEAMLHEELDKYKPEDAIKNFFKEHIDIEHIQAYNDRNNAEEVREIWEDEINSIGNLMILESSINRSIGNYHFSDKKLKYKESKYQIAKNISALNQWTKEDAEKRRAEAVKRISEYIYSDL